MAFQKLIEIQFTIFEQTACLATVTVTTWNAAHSILFDASIDTSAAY